MVQNILNIVFIPKNQFKLCTTTSLWNLLFSSESKRLLRHNTRKATHGIQFTIHAASLCLLNIYSNTSYAIYELSSCHTKHNAYKHSAKLYLIEPIYSLVNTRCINAVTIARYVMIARYVTLLCCLIVWVNSGVYSSPEWTLGALDITYTVIGRPTGC